MHNRCWAHRRIRKKSAGSLAGTDHSQVAAPPRANFPSASSRPPALLLTISYRNETSVFLIFRPRFQALSEGMDELLEFPLNIYVWKGSHHHLSLFSSHLNRCYFSQPASRSRTRSHNFNMKLVLRTGIQPSGPSSNATFLRFILWECFEILFFLSYSNTYIHKMFNILMPKS